MATIDTSQIEGYSEMSPEEKVAALEAFNSEEQAAEHEPELEKKPAWRKRKRNAETENHADNELEELREQVEQLRRENSINSCKARFIALGYDEKLAADTAEAMVDGKTDVVLANQQIFMTAHDKSFKAELLKSTPRPRSGKGSEGMTLEKLKAMSRAERLAFAQEYPEEYKELYGGNS